MKTTWDLTTLYKNGKDPQIEKDMQVIESVCISFEKKYKKNNFIKTPHALAKALEEYKKVQLLLEESKPWWYFALQTHIDNDNTTASAVVTLYEQRITNASNRVAFFILVIGSIDKKQQTLFLKSPVLKEYTYFLQRIFLQSQHMLTESEERLETMLNQPGFSMWIDGQQKLLNKQVVQWKGKQIPISEVFSVADRSSTKDRRALYAKAHDVFKNISHFAESEINALYTYKKIMDEQRGYKKPYSATILSYENKESNIEMLVELVTRNFSLSKKFYKIHAQLLGEKVLMNADRGAKIGVIKKNFTFESSTAILKNAFAKVDPQYASILDSFIENGQIDVYPKKGKRGGAYCWSMGQLPTRVLLNHTDDMRSLEVFGHEMGHAFHSHFSKQQTVYNQGYPMSTAEVASTFFEQVALSEIEKELSDSEKIIFLHNKISNDIATIFRQIACFNFELELHKRIRSEGQLSAASIADLLVKHMKAYMGKDVVFGENDGYFFVKWNHIRSFFYVYTYAYGQLISRSLFEAWKNDNSFGKKIEQFLRAGRSMSPEDIFKSIGVDIAKPEFFELGLTGVAKDIAMLEKLINSRNGAKK